MVVLAVVLSVLLPLLALGALLLVISGAFSSGGTVAPHASSLSLDGGRVVWTDSVPHSGDGWFSGTDSDGVLFDYENGSYEINAVDVNDDDGHAATAPYSSGLAAMEISAELTVQVPGSLGGAGLRCEHAGGNATTHYVAFLFPDGTLDLDRYPGSSGGNLDQPTPIGSTSFGDVGGTLQGNEMELACITAAKSGGQQTTRILVEVNGDAVSFTDTFATSGNSDWYGGVESEADSVVDFNELSISNLEG
jgi:hypothetical protein